jgi:hypothetical protein
LALGVELDVHAPEVPVQTEAPALQQLVRWPVGSGHLGAKYDSLPRGRQRRVLRGSSLDRVQEERAEASTSVLRVDGPPPVQLAVIRSGQ